MVHLEGFLVGGSVEQLHHGVVSLHHQTDEDLLPEPKDQLPLSRGLGTYTKCK